MLQNPCKPLGFKKNMVYKFPPGGGGGGKPYPASGLLQNLALSYFIIFMKEMCGSRRGRQDIRISSPSPFIPQSYQATRFLSNTGPDPLNNHN